MHFSDHDWDALLTYVGRRQVIPVVGADILTVDRDGQAVSLSSRLAERLAEYLKVPGEPDEGADSAHSVTCRFLEVGGEWQDVYSALNRVTSDEAIAIPRVLSKLAEIEDFGLFVSTTFDSLLEQAIDEVRFAGDSQTVSVSFSPGRPN